jgi:poly(A) polymerase
LAEQPYLFEGLVPDPVIVPRPEHCVSRRDIDRDALKVLYRLKDHGYISYLVGGSVRDLLINRRPKDFDVGTNATPDEVRRLFRYSRIIGRRFRLVHVYFRGGKIIEVSTFRRQSEFDDQEAAREGIEDDGIFGSPREDAFRRDLTINGLFYNVADFSVIDYVGGMADLTREVIRTIGDPDRRFLRDPVRMMRAIRHAARIGFTIEPNTWAGICRHGDKIRLCAVPRVRDEWLKDLRSGSGSEWARLMFESGLFASVFSSYVSSLDDGRAQRVRGMLLGLLNRLDALVREGTEISEAFLLALFTYPRLHVMPQWQELRSDRIRWPTHEARSLINELISPYDFKKSIRDGAAQILSSQWAIGTCISQGTWPKRVWNKSTFREALRLYDSVQEFLGLPVIGPDPHLDLTKGRELKRRGKRRHPRSRHTDT